jgi:predicted AlkP superfamily phosphohydrolase/phosphomutase
LQALRAAGILGRLRTTAEVMHVSAAPSFHIGVHPGEHGLFHAYQIRPGEQICHRTHAKEAGLPPFWKFLDDRGKRCVVLDAFMTCPLEGFNGTHVADWGTWSWFSEPTAKPPEVWKEIQSRFGAYPAPDSSKVLSMPDPERFRDQLLAGIQRKGEVIKWLLRRGPWDLFYAMFAETHPAGHFLWHLYDSSYPAHPPQRAGELAGALRDVYIATDRMIGEIISGLAEDVAVFVVSVDGMGPNYSGCHLLEEVLKKLGFTHMLADLHETRPDRTEPTANGKKDLLKLFRDMVPSNVRRKISVFLPRHLQQQLSTRWMTANVDWVRTRAFCIPNANEGYIRINLRGREPEGVVEPGTEYHHVCDELTKGLKALVNPQTNQPAVREVVNVDDIFPGERRDHLADLVVQWNPEAKITTELYSQACGLVRSEQPGYALTPFYTGNHRPVGFVIARCPSIPARQTLNGAHILDLAPTFLGILGVDPPPHMGRRLWSESDGHLLRQSEAL